MVDLQAQYETLRSAAGACFIDRDVVRVTGDDAVTFLQGQVSQDVASLDDGASVLSFILEPQGKVDAFVRVTRVGDAILLDTDAGCGEALIARLSRFRLRAKVAFEPIEWRCLALRGPGVSAALETVGRPAVALRAFWPGWDGADLLGEDVDIPDGVELVAAEVMEYARIEAGFPRHGSEITDRTIPAETGWVPAAVSFTKGCYTGQELVARIDSRGGNVPRRLCRLDAEGSALIAGATIEVDGKEAGTVTSVASLPGRAVALGYVRRGVEVPAEATVRSDAAESVARLHPLPALA